MSTIGQFGQHLSRTNTWWRDPQWTATDPDLAEARNTGLEYRATCLDQLLPGGLYILRGPRRVGKTVATKQAIENLIAGGTPPTSIVRVAVDGWHERELRTLVQNTALPPVPGTSHRWWFIDGITSVSGNWATEIKWLRDNDAAFREASVVLTGSNARGLREAVGTLAGRRGKAPDLDRTLLPIGFRTFAGFFDPSLTSAAEPMAVSELRAGHNRDRYEALLPWLDGLVVTFERYLGYGGFPLSVAAALSGEPVPENFVEDVFNVVFRDAFAGSGLSETQTTALLARLARGLGSPVNLSNIANDLGVSQDTVTRRIADLRNAYLVWQCPQIAADDRWIPRQRAQNKLYFVDPIAARLAHLRSTAQPDPDTTVLVENQLGTALRRRREHDRPGRWADHDWLFFARTKSRKEIDFIAEPLAGVALESKYTDRGTWASDAATVNASAWTGVLATQNVLDCTGRDHDAWAVPAAMLAYLIDT